MNLLRLYRACQGAKNMAFRTKRGQVKHDQKVADWVNRLKGPGKQVLADLPGYQKPDPVFGRIPDVMVKQGGKVKVVGEVETPISLKDDQSQISALKQGAKHLGASFRLKIAKEKRGGD